MAPRKVLDANDFFYTIIAVAVLYFAWKYGFFAYIIDRLMEG
jgi:hypothetical protein